MAEKTTSLPKTLTNGTPSGNETLLESWKEIAAYLQRDERTARRWEKHEALPVRRHRHLSRSSVYAYPRELDAWRATRRPDATPEPAPLWRRPLPSFALAGLLLLSLLTAGGGPYSRPVMAARRSGIVARQVWAGPDVDTLGAPSQDGAYLTFQDHSSEDLAIRDLVTEQKRRLTNKGPVSLEFALASVPSPDGKQVAYAWYNKNHFYDLRIVGLDGTEPRVLYSNAEVKYLETTDWSPDGKSVLAVFNRKDRSNQIILVSVGDGSVRLIKSFDHARSPSRPRFSPDGRYIVYALPQRPESREQDIFVLALDDGHETLPVQHPANDSAPDWTPDGKRILFHSDRTGAVGAWWIQVADGKPLGTPELVKSDLGGDPRAMGFTRNGSYYYGVRTGMSDVYIAELDLARGKLRSAPIAAAQRFVGSNSKPDWSSDGEQLLYLSQRGPGVWGPKAFCVRSAENGEVRELTSKLDRVNWARWSPDGRSLLAAAQHPSGQFGIYRLDVQSGGFNPVPLNGALGWPAVWSRDGKSIFYQRSAAKRMFIVVRNLETGQERELHSIAYPSHYAGGVALSRDGQQLAVIVAEAEGGSKVKVLKVLPAAGGEARDLLRGVQTPWRGPITWAPDGQSVLFVRQPSLDDLKTELWLISVRGDEPRKLDLTAEDMRDLSIHPDGRRIAFTAGQDRFEVWVLENLLPGSRVAAN